MTLTKDEVDKRVALLKRLKATLSQQREKFQSYLQVLDAERASIDGQSEENLKVQVEMEEELVVDIHAIQKVIDPLEAVLQQTYQEAEDEEVRDLRSVLDRLKVQVEQKSQENRGLLAKTMDSLRSEMARIRPQIRGHNPYVGSRASSSLVDITT